MSSERRRIKSRKKHRTGRSRDEVDYYGSVIDFFSVRGEFILPLLWENFHFNTENG